MPLTAYKAVVIESVVNLIGQSMCSFYPTTRIDLAYKKIPLCSGKINRWISCPRLHQVLFNEIVDVIDTVRDEVKVRIPTLLYITMRDKKPQDEYWGPRTAFVPLSEVSVCNGISAVPLPVDYHHPRAMAPTVVTLTLPYHDSQTGLTFSAGTRFVYQQKKQDTKKRKHISVICYNPRICAVCTVRIPRSQCIVSADIDTRKKQREHFVNIIKQWAHMSSGYIPYVWGGCSFVQTKSGPFKEKVRTRDGVKTSYFSYGKNMHRPYTGLDCSGLVSRAAQIAGLPYFYKNSYTAVEYMKPLKQGEHVQVGDLIWVPGHLIVISDIEQHLLIEARSYFSGYGRVHELPLNKVFHGINTYQELEQAYFKKSSIKRMDKSGAIQDSFVEYAILTLESIWSAKCHEQHSKNVVH
jgi:hypothetical protein